MKKGFTLLELIVATTIFTIVLSATYALFSSGRAVTVRAEKRARLLQTARAALRAIEADLRGAVMSGSAFDSGLIGTSKGTSTQPEDTLDLVAVNRHIPWEDEKGGVLEWTGIDLSRVTWQVEKNRGLVRERHRELTPVTVFTGREENKETVAEGVVGLDFRYYDSGWEESWDSTRRYKLPRAIEATIHARAEEGEAVEKFSTTVYLAVGAETPEKQP